MKQKTFRDYYKLPLSQGYSKVFGGSGMAFDFAFDMLYPNHYRLTKDQQAEIVGAINGEHVLDVYWPNAVYNPDDTTIYVDGKEFIIIRGWGMLRGPGGFNLPDEEAKRIQDEFANFVLETIQGKHDKNYTS